MPYTIAMTVKHGDQPVATYQFDDASHQILKLGKLSSAHVRLEGNGISRVHAIIELKPEGPWLIDMGGPGGTKVNAGRVNKVALHDGDRIEIGDLTVGVALAGQAAASQPAVVRHQPVAPSAPVAPAVPGAAAPAPATARGPAAPQPARPAAPAAGYAVQAATLPAINVAGLPADVAGAINALSAAGQLELRQYLAFLSWRDRGAAGPAPQPPASAPPQAYGMQPAPAAAAPGAWAAAAPAAAAPRPSSGSWQGPGRAVSEEARRSDANGVDEGFSLKLHQARQKRMMLTLGALAAGLVVVAGLIVWQSQAPSGPEAGGAESAGAAGPALEPAGPRDPATFYYFEAEPGRSAEDVAMQLYWNQEHAALIAKANGLKLTEKLSQRRVLKIPKYTDYTAEAGESLTKIAMKQLGRADLWEAIHKVNLQKLGSDPRLSPGQTIRLPLIKIELPEDPPAATPEAAPATGPKDAAPASSGAATTAAPAKPATKAAKPAAAEEEEEEEDEEDEEEEEE